MCQLKSFRYVFIFIFIFLFILCSCRTQVWDFYIFNEISELKEIENSVETEITVYNEVSKDKYLKDLKYNDYFGCKYTSNQLEFEIFAYEFVDKSTADNYYKKVTGKTNEHKTVFSDVAGMNNFRRIVVHENKAYSVYCSANKSEEVLSFIKTYLPVKLAFEKNTDSR